MHVSTRPAHTPWQQSSLTAKRLRMRGGRRVALAQPSICHLLLLSLCTHRLALSAVGRARRTRCHCRYACPLPFASGCPTVGASANPIPAVISTVPACLCASIALGCAATTYTHTTTLSRRDRRAHLLEDALQTGQVVVDEVNLKLQFRHDQIPSQHATKVHGQRTRNAGLCDRHTA